MESFFIRYRNLLVLLAVLVAQIAGLAVQVRRVEGGYNILDEQDSRGVRLIRYWAQALVGPPERLIHGTKLGVENIWSGYIDLRHVRQQNHDLEKTVDRLRLEQAELLQDAEEGQRLQAMLGFEQHYIYSTVAAQVFGSSGSVQSKVFYIDKGAADGLKRDMPVITADGIVGKVRDVLSQHTAQILAINDQTSGAGVILEATRIRGILKGNAAGQLEIVGLMADQRIKPGEKVLTAGGDMIFPRGLPVGTVQKVVPDPDRDSFIDVLLTPAAHIDQLDEVLVITSMQTSLPAQQQNDIATSEELKGAEAEAIKEQVKASQIMAERLPGLTDPNQPAANAPANGQQPNAASQNGATAGQANPAEPPAPKLLPTMHADRFSPAGAASNADEEKTEPDPEARPKPKRTLADPASAAGAGTTHKTAAATPAAKPHTPAKSSPQSTLKSSQPSRPGRTQ